MANYNQDVWRLIKEKVEDIVKESVDKAIAEHEAKAASDTFANSHAVTP